MRPDVLKVAESVEKVFGLDASFFLAPADQTKMQHLTSGPGLLSKHWPRRPAGVKSSVLGTARLQQLARPVESLRLEPVMPLVDAS